MEFPVASWYGGDRGACADDDDDAPTVRGLNSAGIPGGAGLDLMPMGTSSKRCRRKASDADSEVTEAARERAGADWAGSAPGSSTEDPEV